MNAAFVFLLFVSWQLNSPAQEKKSDAQQFIPWLLADERDLKTIPFPEVVKAATGKSIIPFDVQQPSDRELLAGIGAVMNDVLKRMNAPNTPAQKQKRINEVSSHFENEIKRTFNGSSEFKCDFPKTAAGKVQRSGYPDLRLVHIKSKRIIYLDPKLYEKGNRDSTFRTFYFEPKKETNKILDDAHHLLVGFEHSGTGNGEWRFLSWELVDLSRFQVRLKAEFQGSNKDLYRKEAVVGTSRR